MIPKDISPQVNVLISTYNGKSYLLEQFESLYQQTHPNIRIIVRDDGSSDLTLDILQKEALLKKISLDNSNSNIGPAKSFFKLLDTYKDADFYSFCDQDDIWYPNKLERALDALKSLPDDTPAMYFSRCELVDSKNRSINLSATPKKIGFGNALVENIATGCTIVLNNSARDLLVTFLPDKCLMHDSWCYLVISCFGQILYDETPTIRYRQHSNNTIGAATSNWDNFVRRLKRLRFNKKEVFRFSDQAAKFLTLFESMIPQSNKILIKQIVAAKTSFSVRICLALSSKIWRQSILDNAILRVLILLNKF